MILLLVILSFFAGSVKASEYLINFQAKIVSSETHNYTRDSNFNLIKLDGSFTDNLGNYGIWNALVSYELSKGLIKQHFFSSEIIYQNESKCMFKDLGTARNLNGNGHIHC